MRKEAAKLQVIISSSTLGISAAYRKRQIVRWNYRPLLRTLLRTVTYWTI